MKNLQAVRQNRQFLQGLHQNRQFLVKIATLVALSEGVQQSKLILLITIFFKFDLKESKKSSEEISVIFLCRLVA